ncbi:hypothetical protein PsorP6_011366 [Peronosclerospora sorghi]|uniref:Uncharacterized protein n=1 Tax=Peronosclerospora sorghi TaxID=230839 RepID=A0ACC0WMH0_9STRA|nr:hypothetical protein PsorP6_011366 [Peronosclerospora sorghi]
MSARPTTQQRVARKAPCQPLVTAAPFCSTLKGHELQLQRLPLVAYVQGREDVPPQKTVRTKAATLPTPTHVMTHTPPHPLPHQSVTTLRSHSYELARQPRSRKATCVPHRERPASAVHLFREREREDFCTISSTLSSLCRNLGPLFARRQGCPSVASRTLVHLTLWQPPPTLS